jgi:SAM-dependent methyltransferase
MSQEFSNVYDDEKRADAYARLEFPGTYYVAYRDLPSTRFLRGLGFDVVGVDVSASMLARARERDPEGEYRLVPDGDLGGLTADIYDLVLSAFTFDNIPTRKKKITLFRSLRHLLKSGGHIVSIVSAPEIYVNEWASFSTKDYPENRAAKSGDTVRIVMLDVEDSRPVEDVLWTDEDYFDVYARAGLAPIKTYRPLAKPTEPYAWVSETTIAPWVIYLLGGGGKV